MKSAASESAGCVNELLLLLLLDHAASALVMSNCAMAVSQLLHLAVCVVQL